jgi:hypothetical protein
MSNPIIIYNYSLAILKNEYNMSLAKVKRQISATVYDLEVV